MYGVQTNIYDQYFEEVGAHYNIPPLLLKKIAVIESDLDPNSICKNKNGTVDYGIMQINSIHFKKLAKWGISEKNIMNPRVNIYAGGWLLSEHIKNNGFNFQAIGLYHSATPTFKEVWLDRLVKALKRP